MKKKIVFFQRYISKLKKLVNEEGNELVDMSEINEEEEEMEQQNERNEGM